jgi:hypothetical protein
VTTDKKADRKPGTTDAAPGIDYQDERGPDRYVGGGPRGGQNFSNEGYAANQSASAGDGYSSPPEHPGGAASADYAVQPEDLGVKDYDLQGTYGRPPEDDKQDGR